MLAGQALHHRVLQPRVGIVGFLVRQHRPQLPGMLVGDRHQHLAKRQPAGQLADPDLLACGLFCADHLGALQCPAPAKACSTTLSSIGGIP